MFCSNGGTAVPSGSKFCVEGGCHRRRLPGVSHYQCAGPDNSPEQRRPAAEPQADEPARHLPDEPVRTRPGNMAKEEYG
jgi:hypothetical protein